MSEFKVGDKVRWLADVGRMKKGDISTVAEVLDDGFLDTRNIYGRGDDVEPVGPDGINHPQHYKWLPVEAIEITEHFNFCMGNALKYIIRADHKGKPVEDLRKALFYIKRELRRRGYEGDL